MRPSQSLRHSGAAGEAVHQRHPLLVAVIVALVVIGTCGPRAYPRDLGGQETPRATRVAGGPAVPLAVPNDNRVAAGARRGAVHELHLEATLAGWRPDLAVDSAVTVRAFAERGGPPRIPGPLLRVPSGSDVRVEVTNALPDSALLVRGLRAGTVGDDTLRVPRGASREVRFRAGAPGTYLYRGATSVATLERPTGGRDDLMAGVIVVDPPDGGRDPDERIFVVSLIDIVPDTTKPKPHEDVWEVAINGRSWPHTERLSYAVGDTVRWRWVNASDRSHPMHLHGFHFLVTRKGNGHADTTYRDEERRLAVTEFVPSGSTMAMEWVPTRAGAWLFHCHMAAHITPYPERPDSVRRHDAHDLARHPLESMAGLVLGITTTDRGAVAGAGEPPPARRLRVLAQQKAPPATGEPRRSFVIQRERDPAADSVDVPSAPLVLVRGEPVEITVVNRLREHTSVHWHGMELASVFDGVAGWSASGTAMAPLVAPGDSFAVRFAPPRAGTYIYHTHMDEGAQLRTGMYGAMLVLEPGERRDPATDHVIIVGMAVDDSGKVVPAINGRASPPPLVVRAGRTHRLRIVNILVNPPVTIVLGRDSVPERWRLVSKDGARLPTPRAASAARQVVGVGETYDFEWTPTTPGDVELFLEPARRAGLPSLRLRVRVVAPEAGGEGR